MTVARMLRIEVVYAAPERQARYALELPDRATVRDAIEASGVCADFPAIDLAANRVGIYGKLAALETTLRDRDRVEILRPLAIDPKEARRRRAARGKR